MPVTYHLHVDSPDVNSLTGQHTVEVTVEEHQEDGTVVKGVKEKYGMSAAEINQRFGGDVDKWLAWIGREMLAKHKFRQNVHHDLMSRRGHTLQITE